MDKKQALDILVKSGLWAMTTFTNRQGGAYPSLVCKCDIGDPRRKQPEIAAAIQVVWPGYPV